jgi:hypothetical protein
MPRWFLSYHSPDQSLAERLKGAIERKGPVSSVFLAPSNLRAGGAWTAQPTEQLAGADAFSRRVDLIEITRRTPAAPRRLFSRGRYAIV